MKYRHDQCWLALQIDNSPANSVDIITQLRVDLHFRQNPRGIADEFRTIALLQYKSAYAGDAVCCAEVLNIL